MLQYYSIVILSVVTSHIVTAQECTTLSFDNNQYSGHVVINPTDGTPRLEGDSSSGGIRFLVGCSGTDIPGDLTWSGEPASVWSKFTVTDDVRAVDKKLLVLAADYDLVTNMEIIFTMTACSTANPSQCASAVTVTVTYPYNAHDPSFNHLFGEATIADAEACNAKAGLADCEAVFNSAFSGSDADGDVLEYSILPFTDHSNLFRISDPSTLSISYIGSGVTQEMDITLLVKAKERRTLDDARSAVAVVKIKVLTTAEITTKTPTEPPTEPPTENPTEAPECDDKNKKLYFIIMIALAGVLGALLLLLLCIPICMKCCRSSSSLSIASSTKATVKNAGVFTAGASYKSFSEMNYITLQDSPPSYTSSPDLGAKADKHASGRVRSRAKSSKRNLPSGEDSWGQGGHSSDSTASVQERERGDAEV